MNETVTVAGPGTGQRLTTHRCDVSVENEVEHEQFRDVVLAAHNMQSVHLLINNAGTGGGGEFVTGDRDVWERTFAVCWYGVYYGCRSFMPALMASDSAHLVNVSSINGFWANIGAGVPHNRVFSREVCREGLFRSFDYRSQGACAACQSIGGYAGAHRNINCDQYAAGALWEQCGCRRSS